MKKFLKMGIVSIAFITPSLLAQNIQKNLERPQEKKPARDNTLTILAVGDIMLSRGVAARIIENGSPLYPFQKMDAMLQGTDFNFGNLEGPMTGQPNIHQGHLVFNAPINNVVGLIKNHFVVNTANNHILDQGEQGLTATLNNLHFYKIPTIGTGNNLTEAWQPTFIKVKGEIIAFIGASYTAYNQRPKAKSQQVARIQQLENLAPEINYAKKYADFIVVTMHAGKEYTRNPNEEQIAFAHEAIKDGADIVIGAHPHWIQQIEQFHHKYIFYSLGNFIFDQDWSQNTREGLVLKLVLQKISTAENTHKLKLSFIQLIPVTINHSVPSVATAAQSAKILEKIGIPPCVSYRFPSQ